MPVRVLIAEEHSQPIYRIGLRLLLERMPQIQVCGDVVGGDAICAALANYHPDILLFCLHQATSAEFNLLIEILDLEVDISTIVLTGISDMEVQQHAVSLGVLGLVKTDATPETLQHAIERVYAGELWTDRTLAAGVLTALTRHKTPRGADGLEGIAKLSDREREVIALVGEGLKNPAIAERLFISEAAVRHRLTSIFEKLPVDDRLGLAMFAYRHGLATLPR